MKLAEKLARQGIEYKEAARLAGVNPKSLYRVLPKRLKKNKSSRT